MIELGHVHEHENIGLLLGKVETPGLWTDSILVSAVVSWVYDILIGSEGDHLDACQHVTVFLGQMHASTTCTNKGSEEMAWQSSFENVLVRDSLIRPNT
jgi:hypothetical protein